jgi:hypothetical protein
VNSASVPVLSVRLERSWANQPDSTFPQSPGIILEAFVTFFRLLPATSVLSMNCDETIRFSDSNNELLSTWLFTKNHFSCGAPDIRSSQCSKAVCIFHTRVIHRHARAKCRRGEQLLHVSTRKNRPCGAVRLKSLSGQAFLAGALTFALALASRRLLRATRRFFFSALLYCLPINKSLYITDTLRLFNGL